MFVLFIAIAAWGCKKDSAEVETLSGPVVAVSQDAESQDALVENVDQSMDNTVEALETNDFSGLKSAMVGGPSYTVVSNNGKTASDTTLAAFPKVVTLTYNTDTTINGERFKQTGVIKVYFGLKEAKYPWRNFVKREIVFKDYKVENDSSSITITGNRVVKRIGIKTVPARVTLNNTSFTLVVADSINSDLTILLTSGDFQGSFTRKVKHRREAYAHFERLAGAKMWRQAFLKDTLILKGSVSGKNLLDSAYSRKIVADKPLTITRCALGVPVMSSGVIEIANGNRTGTITYSSDGCKSKAVLESGGLTKEIERKINRKYSKWW